MKISIIIPSRNRTKSLKNCLDSIAIQSLLPYEVTIIVHQEDSRTKQFLQEINTNFTLNYFETDGGTCKSRNVGIKFSKGEILIFIEDDVILHEKYVENVRNLFLNSNLDVLAGYTFDIVDLTTPYLLKKGDLDYILKHKEEDFFKVVIDYRSSLGFSSDIGKINSLFSFFMRKIRNFFKIIILQEGVKKGKILSSGYRSEMPVITNIDGLYKVEWVNGGNFAIKRSIADEFKFNENMELLDYVLGEDLEFSARIISEYDIYLSSEIKLFHLRSSKGIKINNKERFRSMIINFNRIAIIRGNMFAYWWSVIGLLISRLFLIPFKYNQTISEIEGIVEGIKYL